MSSNLGDNLKLWYSVSTTEKKYTKPAKKGQYNFTSITPISQFKEATKVFGIQGIGWGVKIGSEEFTEKEIGKTSLLNYDAILYFTYEGDRGEIPIHATEKLCYQTQGANGYLKIDDEVRKKVVTNAKTKGLSELGFNADIFLGMFDDPNYVEYITLEQKLNDADNKEEEVKTEIEKFNEWCRKEVAVYPALKSKRTLNLVSIQHKTKLQGKCTLLKLDEVAYTKQFKSAYDKQLKLIEDNVKDKTKSKKGQEK